MPDDFVALDRDERNGQGAGLSEGADDKLLGAVGMVGGGKGRNRDVVNGVFVLRSGERRSKVSSDEDHHLW